MPLFNCDLFLKKGYKDEKETKKRKKNAGKVKQQQSEGARCSSEAVWLNKN